MFELMKFQTKPKGDAKDDQETDMDVSKRRRRGSKTREERLFEDRGERVGIPA